MDFATIIWSVAGTAALSLGFIQLLAWLYERAKWERLVFFFMTVGSAGISFTELGMVRATTAHEFSNYLRWLHLPTWIAFVSIVIFVHLHLRTANVWLGGLAIGARTVSLIINFLQPINLNYREVAGLRNVSFPGGAVSVIEGVPNPWMLVGQLSLFLLVAFVVNASWTAWRDGNRRSALVTGGSIVFFVLSATVQAVLVLWKVVDWPLTTGFFFLGVVAVTAFDLSRETLLAGRLSTRLHESEQRMTLAAEAANLGIWIRDLLHNDIWASAKWRELFGFGPTERLEMEDVLRRIHPEDQQAVRKIMEKTLVDGGRYDAEYRVILPDGKIRWVSSHGRLELDEKGRPLRMRGVSRDFTARKSIELEALRHRNELTHLSRVKTLGELSSSLAHELNQPLMAILSNAQAAQRFLKQEPANLAEVREILADIVLEDQRAGEVIRRLRLLLVKGEIQQKPVDINTVVREVSKLLQSDLLNHRVTLKTDLAPNLAEVTGDSVQLQQVLVNLIMNACDAMAGNAVGERQITVRTRAVGLSQLRIEVSDMGCGLPETGPEWVFAPFNTTKGHGLGLGLSVCRTIVTAHGGTIGAENNPERGATFHLTLEAQK
jgi:PAS domain S-box-containing protein